MSLQVIKTWCPLIAGIVICVVTVGIEMVPDAATALQWERGEVSGWLTGHLTHWSWDHLFWDLAVFATLSVAVLRLLPGRYLICLALSAVLITAEIALNQPQFSTYRGLSGIDSALFGLLLMGLWQGSSVSRILAFVGGGAFVAKSLFELQTGGMLFVSSAESNFVPAVSAHFVGFLCGLASGVMPGIDLARLIARYSLIENDDSCEAARTYPGAPFRSCRFTPKVPSPPSAAPPR